MAAAIAPLYATPNAAAVAMPCHDHPSATTATQNKHHPHEAQNTEHAPDQPRDADAANHLCCHQIFTCGPTGALTTAAHKFGDVTGFVLTLATLYIPDSPDRPPRR